MAERKHADAIKAWADGAQIQCRPPQFGLENRRDWYDDNTPAFVDDWEYRVKPADPERARIVDGRGMSELAGIYHLLWRNHGAGKAAVEFSNDVLRHAIDTGQVVTREEFDRMCAEHSKALSDVRQRLHGALFSSPARSWKP